MLTSSHYARPSLAFNLRLLCHVHITHLWCGITTVEIYLVYVDDADCKYSRPSVDCVFLSLISGHPRPGGIISPINVVARYFVPTPTRDSIRGVTVLSHGSSQPEFLIRGGLTRVSSSRHSDQLCRLVSGRPYSRLRRTTRVCTNQSS